MGGPVTKERLETYIPIRIETELQQERIVKMRSREQFPEQRLSDTSRHIGSAGDRMAKKIESRIDLEMEQARIIESNLKEMEEIRKAVSSLKNPMERVVIRLRYIDGTCNRMMPWGVVAMRIYGSDDERHLHAVYRLRDAALQNLLKVWL